MFFLRIGDFESGHYALLNQKPMIYQLFTTESGNRMLVGLI